MSKKEMELKQLHSIKNCYLEMDKLEEQIKAEQKRIEKLKKNVKRHGLKPPESKAKQIRQKLYKPLYTKDEKISKVLSRICLFVGLGAMVWMAVLAFLANAELLKEGSDLSWYDYALTDMADGIADLGWFGLVIFIAIVEIPFVIALCLFNKWIKRQYKIKSLKNGTVCEIKCQVGDIVEKGDALICITREKTEVNRQDGRPVIEKTGKMENVDITATRSGRITKINAKEGEKIWYGDKFIIMQ